KRIALKEQGRLFARRRQIIGLTQKELAELLETERKTIERIEKGSRLSPGPKEMRKLQIKLDKIQGKVYKDLMDASGFLKVGPMARKLKISVGLLSTFRNGGVFTIKRGKMGKETMVVIKLSTVEGFFK